MRLRSLALLGRLELRQLTRLIYYLPSFVKVFSRLVKDPRVPMRPKALLFLVLAYVVVPADLLPDIVLGLGQVDDLLVVLAGLRLFLRLCPKELVQEHVHAIAAGR